LLIHEAYGQGFGRAQIRNPCHAQSTQQFFHDHRRHLTSKRLWVEALIEGLLQLLLGQSLEVITERLEVWVALGHDLLLLLLHHHRVIVVEPSSIIAVHGIAHVCVAHHHHLTVIIVHHHVTPALKVRVHLPASTTNIIGEVHSSCVVEVIVWKVVALIELLISSHVKVILKRIG
jgi:hypothetical protein